MNFENDEALTPTSVQGDASKEAASGKRQADAFSSYMHQPAGCKLCNAGPTFPFSMAYQPILDVRTAKVTAYEALARGPHGEPAQYVLDRMLHNQRYSIDQQCREKAIAMAAQLGLLSTGADLHINFFPNAVYQPKQCLMRTLAAAEAVGFPLTRLVFEITELEQVRDHEHLRNIMTEYREFGLRVAIDDFGAGHSGLALLSEFQPDIVKLDRALVHYVDQRAARRSIVRAIVQICRDLGIAIVAEGIEREEEMQALCDLGIFVMQGYLWAPPAFEALPRFSETQSS